MLKKQTELVFIIDKSGSMSGLENDTLGGFNRLLHEQKELDERCYVTTIFFNTNVSLIHDRTELSEIVPLKRDDYKPGGATALLDAMGYAIAKTERMLKGTLRHNHPHNILFVIITDGEENASREYSKQTIKELVTHKEKEGWVFTFLGANIDAFAAADNLGIRREYAHEFVADEAGLNIMYNNVSAHIMKERKKVKK